MSTVVHVAVGVILDQTNKVLIAKRPAHLHQGGLWEFPGGKVGPNETVQQALARELYEELGIFINQTRPLIRVHHQYTDKSVLLDVWRVESYTGDISGKEYQPIQWVNVDELDSLQFPAANQAIIRAIQLPDIYLITGEFSNTQDCLDRLQANLQQGIRLIQLRAKWLSDKEYKELAEQVLALCHVHGAILMLNTSIELAERIPAHGLHLTSKRLMACNKQELCSLRQENKWVAASVHNETELHQAHGKGIDYVVVAPVLPTQSHPDSKALNWEGLQYLTEQAFCPVYALGGMTPAHLTKAQTLGAQGIAAISSLWPA